MYCSVLSASVHVGAINHNTEGLPGVRHSLHCPCFFFPMLFSHAVFTDHHFFPSLLHWIVSTGLQALLSQKSKLSADKLPPLRALDRDCIKRGVSARSHCSDSPSTAKEAHKENKGFVLPQLHQPWPEITLQDLIPQLPTGPCCRRKSLCGTTPPPLLHQLEISMCFIPCIN